MKWIEVSEKEYAQFKQENNLRQVKNNGRVISEIPFADSLLLDNTVLRGKQCHGQMHDTFEILTDQEKYLNRKALSILSGLI